MKVHWKLLLCLFFIGSLSVAMPGCGEKYPDEPINAKRGAQTADDEENEEAEPEVGSN